MNKKLNIILFGWGTIFLYNIIIDIMIGIAEKSDLSALARIVVEICSDPVLRNYKPVMGRPPAKRSQGLNSQAKESKFSGMQGTFISERYSVVKGINLDHSLKAAVVMFSKPGEVASEKAKLNLLREEGSKLSLAIGKLQKIAPEDPELQAMKDRLVIVKKQVEETVVKTKEKDGESKATHARRALKILCGGATAAESLHQKILMVMMGEDPDKPVEEVSMRAGGRFMSMSRGHADLGGGGDWVRGQMPERVDNRGDRGGRGGGGGGYRDRPYRDFGRDNPRDFGRGYQSRTNQPQPRVDQKGRAQYVPPHLRAERKDQRHNTFTSEPEPTPTTKEGTLPIIIKPIAVKGLWGQYNNTIIGSKPAPPPEEKKPKETSRKDEPAKPKIEKLNYDDEDDVDDEPHVCENDNDEDFVVTPPETT